MLCSSRHLSLNRTIPSIEPKLAHVEFDVAMTALTACPNFRNALAARFLVLAIHSSTISRNASANYI